MTFKTVGYIVNTHGLKGELKIKVQTHFIEERFQKGSCLHIEYENEMVPVVVKQARMNKGMMLVILEGMQDINLVEKFKGCRLCISSANLSQLDEDEIYYSDLMHMQVYTLENQYIGEVCEIIEMGVQVTIRVKGEKELLIPYVSVFVKEVDIQHKKLIVSLLDGML